MPGQDEPALVTVLATGDQVLVAIARGVLESAGVPCIVKGEGLQDLMGVGRFPGGLNLVTGPMELQVRAEDVDEATELLADLHD